jgi:hypothetical protein
MRNAVKAAGRFPASHSLYHNKAGFNHFRSNQPGGARFREMPGLASAAFERPWPPALTQISVAKNRRNNGVSAALLN